MMTSFCVADVNEIEVAVGHLRVGRVRDELAVDAADADGAERAGERDVADHERGARANDEEDVGIVLAVRAQEHADDLRVVEATFREERAQGTIGHAAGEDFFFASDGLRA